MKSIRTTVNLDYTLYLKLFAAVEANELKINDVVDVLISLLRTESSVPMKAFQQVRYQKRVAGRMWKKLHVRMSHARYETGLDLRKLYKFSVSGLLGLGIEMMLERAIAVIKGGGVDNYPPTYTFLAKTPSCYMIFYSLPPENILNFILGEEKNTV